MMSMPTASDQELLNRFLRHRDEAAFTEIVRRHGPMVLGVCRRVLRGMTDEEDAFQATFLVLARKAGSIRQGVALASWLYNVAQRIAADQRGRVTAQKARERHAIADGVRGDPADPLAMVVWHELREVIDNALADLPEKYRAPVVLCHLQGKTHEEAAQILGWPTGTMSRRMAKARELLRARLVRDGMGVSTALIFSALTARHASAAVPAALETKTGHAAVGFSSGAGITSVPVHFLVKGALRTMSLARWQAMASTAAAALLLSTVFGFCAYRSVMAVSQAEADEQALQSKAAQPNVPVAFSDEEKKYVEDIVGNHGTIDLAVGETRLIVMKEPVEKLHLSGEPAEQRNGMMMSGAPAAPGMGPGGGAPGFGGKGGGRPGGGGPSGGGFAGMSGSGPGPGGMVGRAGPGMGGGGGMGMPGMGGMGGGIAGGPIFPAVNYVNVSDRQFMLTGAHAGEATLHLAYGTKERRIAQLTIRVHEAPILPTKQGIDYCPGANPLKQLVGEVVQAKKNIDLMVGQARVWPLKEAPLRYHVSGDGNGMNAWAFDDKTLVLEPLQPGNYTLILWFKDAEDPNKERILSYLLRAVVVD